MLLNVLEQFRCFLKKMSAKENLTANFNFIKHYNPLSFFFYANFIAKMTIYIKKTKR